MSIHDEMKEIVKMMMEHPDEIDKLDFYIHLRNGNVFRYHMDRKKEEKLMIEERLRRQKVDKKIKEIEEKEMKHNLAKKQEKNDNTNLDRSNGNSEG